MSSNYIKEGAILAVVEHNGINGSLFDENCNRNNDNIVFLGANGAWIEIKFHYY